MLIRRALNWLGFSGLSVTEGTQQPTPLTYPAATPVPVSFDTAMQLSAVWACARLITETVASLPVVFSRVSPEGLRAPDNTSDIAQLFAGKVNPYQTRQEFMETFVLNLVMHGNAYAVKVKSGNHVVSLVPLMSAQIETRLLRDGRIVHYYYHDEGVTAYDADSVWHVKLFGNGIVGLSPLGYARNTMGVALAGENRVSQIFSNGGKPSGVLMIDKVLNKEQRDQIRREFNTLREGNEDRLMVLEAAMKYEQISMTPEDIQLLESRRFQIEDIARFFGVPSVLINDTVSSTTWGSGIHEIVQGFYKLNIRPYLERIESSIIQNLMAPGSRRAAHVEFDFDALLRADMGARYEGWQKGINAGMITPNEARAAENLPPVEGGDTLLVNGTMIPIMQASMPVSEVSNGN
jgi:HK97 family phage portal protein